jgi:hypothetical protein
MPEPQARLELAASRAGEVRDVVGYLQALESAYNNIYALDVLIKEASGETQVRYWSRGRRASIKPAKEPDRLVLPEDRLRLTAVTIQSPGLWAFLGAVIPLETIRKWVSDRHERRKDAAYRTQQEELRGTLEIEKLRVEVAQKKVDLLKSAGVPEEQIRKALAVHLFEPLEALNRYQDAGLIETADVKELPKGEGPA